MAINHRNRPRNGSIYAYEARGRVFESPRAYHRRRTSNLQKSSKGAMLLAELVAERGGIFLENRTAETIGGA